MLLSCIHFHVHLLSRRIRLIIDEVWMIYEQYSLHNA